MRHPYHIQYKAWHIFKSFGTEKHHFFHLFLKSMLKSVWNENEMFSHVLLKKLVYFCTLKSFTYYLFTLSSAFTRQNDIKQKRFKYYKNETTRQCYVTYKYFVQNIGFIDLWVDQYVVIEICVLSCLILF